MTLERRSETWTGKWSGVDAAIESMMDELLATVAPEPEIAVKSVSGPSASDGGFVMDLANQGGFTDEQIALVQGNIMGDAALKAVQIDRWWCRPARHDGS